MCQLWLLMMPGLALQQSNITVIPSRNLQQTRKIKPGGNRVDFIISYLYIDRDKNEIGETDIEIRVFKYNQKYYSI